MKRTFKPEDKPILVKGSDAALKVAFDARKKLEKIEAVTMPADTSIARIEDVKGWLDKHASGDRGLLGEIEVSHELCLTMRMCARLYESKVTGVEHEQEELQMETNDARAKLVDVRSLVARLSDQASLEIADTDTKKPATKRRGRERPGGQD